MKGEQEAGCAVRERVDKRQLNADDSAQSDQNSSISAANSERRLARLQRRRLQHVQRDDLQGLLVRGLQRHRRCHTRLPGFPPTVHTQAPTVAGFQAGKAPLRVRGAQVIAPLQ